MNQQLLSYIQTETSKGISADVLKTTLLQSGWKEQTIADTFAALHSPQAPTQTTQIQITEKDYPIQPKWMLKTVISSLFILIVVSFYALFNTRSIYFIFYAIYLPVHFITTYLSWKNFHYALEPKFLVVSQGFFSKQQRNLPYGVIQNVFVKRDLLDRILGLASLAIENASGGGQLYMPQKQQKKQMSDSVGFKGNRVSIPGLSVHDAETLKSLILQKMKENPLEDNHSGL